VHAGGRARRIGRDSGALGSGFRCIGGGGLRPVSSPRNPRYPFVISAIPLPWSIMLAPVAEPDDALELARQRAQERDRERERALVERAQAGDRKAVGELLTRHGQSLYRNVLLPRLGSEAAAQDALGETYAKVVERIGQFRWQNVGFYPWLRMVALRVALDALRAKKRLVLWEAEDLEREIDEASHETPVDQSLSDRRDREAARAKVDAALERLHPRYARVIRMRILEERAREEVAAELGVTPATFDVLLHRAIAALKKGLEAPPSVAAAPANKKKVASEVGDDDA
jgi:RNA polymerase sigma factor (sigma-70 family)